MTTERKCERCGTAFEADSRRAKTKRFCSPHCRYEAWVDGQEEKLMKKVRDLAKRGVRL